jgi:hypothetical protein
LAISHISQQQRKLCRAIAAVEAIIAAHPNHLDLINDYGKILMINEPTKKPQFSSKSSRKQTRVS